MLPASSLIRSYRCKVARKENRASNNEARDCSARVPQRSGRREERWSLVSSVTVSPRSAAVTPWPTPSWRTVARAEAMTAMLMMVALLFSSAIVAYHAACRLRPQSEEEKADRGVLRLVEGHRAAAQAETSGSVQSGMDLYLRSSGLQPCAYAKADSDFICRMTRPKCLCSAERAACREAKQHALNPLDHRKWVITKESEARTPLFQQPVRQGIPRNESPVLYIANG